MTKTRQYKSTDETTSHPAKLANYANQAIGYARTGIEVAQCSSSSCTSMYTPVPRSGLPQSRSARYDFCGHV